MTIRKFQTFDVDNDDVSTLQGNVKKTLDDMAQYFPAISVLCAGKLLEEQFFVGPGTDNIVYHNLGRPIKGWIIVNTPQIVNLYRSPTVQTPEAIKTQVVLRIDVAAAFITLWVF